jgi:prevent-host-death family protein
MAHVTYSQLRSKLAATMNEVCDDRTPLLVTRRNARSVVLMSEQVYDGLTAGRPAASRARTVWSIASSYTTAAISGSRSCSAGIIIDAGDLSRLRREVKEPLRPKFITL